MFKNLSNKIKVLIISIILLIISTTIIVINGKTYNIKFDNIDSSYKVNNLIMKKHNN